MTIRFLLLLITLFASRLAAQSDEWNESGPYENKVFSDSIRSITFQQRGLPLSLPVWMLGSNSELLFEFDEVGDYAENYSYSIELCTHDWLPVQELTPFDYIDGYDRDLLSNYEFSNGSLQPYTHYRLRIPNENCRPLLAGNYILRIFKEDPSDPVIIRKFFVARQLLSIEANIHQSDNIQRQQTHQEVDFKVLHKGMIFANPFQSINASIIQNGNIDGARIGLKPAFIQDNVLSFDLSGDNEFQGMKEFRWFDLRSLIHYGERIKLVKTHLGRIHVFISPDEVRSYKQYFYHEDMNGRFILKTLDETVSTLQARYAEVHFTLPLRHPFQNGDIYIMGALSDWKTGKDNRMIWNPKRKAYEGRLFLKQGFYNYLYGFKKSDQEDVNYETIEGNFFDTENDYTIFIYHRPFGERYDELIAVKTFNTIKGKE